MQVIKQAPSTWDKLKSPINSIGAMYQKFKNDLSTKNENIKALKDNAGSVFANAFAPRAEASTGETYGASKADTPNGPYNSPNYQPVAQKPSDPGAPAKSNGSSSSSNSKIINALGRGWNDAGDVIKDTKSALNSSKNYIGNLGKVRDQYIDSLDKYKNKTDQAISGNKTLIEQNQKRDLDTLAGDTRKTMQNTNVMLGVKGASGGSASRMASRAIAQSAGKSRAGVLTGYGDETSKQNLASKNAVEEYHTKREQAYEWEKTARKEAEDEFKAQEKALSRLNNKKSGWKDADIKAESDRNLNSFLGSLNQIQLQSKAFRDNLAAKYTEYGGQADLLDQASVNVDAPAELDTPVFDENINLNSTTAAEDWYNPDKTGKKVIKGYDAMGNPIFADEVATDAPTA